VTCDSLWSDTDEGQLKNYEKHLSQCHFAYEKLHKDWPGMKRDLSGDRPATDRLRHGKTPTDLQVSL